MNFQPGTVRCAASGFGRAGFATSCFSRAEFATSGFSLTLIAALLTLVMAVPAPAQQSTVDVNKLPIDVERIQRQLQQSAIREEHDGLNLRYFLSIYGQAPRIELFAPQENLRSGPVPYGAPTHREIIDHITPREYRAPAADVSALFRWLADKTKDRGGK